ncbi:MAG TPA: hypothetical protein VFN44_07545, partial [Solirubrobacteraceae bacterium]|nr:hypothetical protein [Solirubrobacteraceae bacterium]
MPSIAHRSQARIAALALAAAVLAVVPAGATSAHAATRCALANGLLEVHMTESGDNASFAVANGTIGISGRTSTVTCTGGTPTTRTVDTVLVVDDSDKVSTPAGNDGTTTVSIIEPGLFGPGKTEEPFSEDEIEFLVDTRNGSDNLTIGGQGQQRIVVGNDGLNWNFDEDRDVIGMPFDDIRVFGSSGHNDFLSGRGGDGTGPALSTATFFGILPFSGDDIVLGSDIPAGDSLEGGDGNDMIEGFAGPDTINGGPGNDTLDGAAGDDTVIPSIGDDTIRGGADSDTVDFRFAGNGVNVDLARSGAQATGEGSDSFADVENVTGSQLFGDRLSGTAGANVLDGIGGGDVLEGRGGADELRGGDGSDTVSYAGAAGPVTVDLARITQSGGERLNSIENAAGSPFADLLTGNAVANVISGGAGADTIAAADGDDRVELRDGEGDRAACGAGADSVVADRRSLDAVEADCETVDALAEPEPEPQPGGSGGAPD